MTPPTMPTLHRFEVDPASGRITGIRFRMSDGTEQVVGARVHEVALQPDKDPADEWVVDGVGA